MSLRNNSQIFFIVSLFFWYVKSSHSYEVFYDHYDFNRVYGERAVMWSQDTTYVIGDPVKKNYPEPVTNPPSSNEVKRPPFFLAVRVSPPDSSPDNVPVVEKSERCALTARKDVVVYFPFNRASLTEDQKKKLISEVESFMKDVKTRSKDSSTCEIQADVTGYACPLGSDVYNRKLSKKRAETVRNLLEKMGIRVKTTQPGGELKESEILCLNRKAVIHLEVK